MAERAVRRARRRSTGVVAGAERPRTRDSTAPAGLRIVRPPRSRTRDTAAETRTNLRLLLIPAVSLTLIGIVMVLSASSVSAITECGSGFCFFFRQVIYAIVGMGALLVVRRLDYHVWQRVSVPLLGVSVFLLLLALHPTAGVSAYGASRWLNVGPVTIQPSEIAKLALIAFAATVIVRKWKRLDDPWHVAIPLVPVVIVVAGIVILQRDLGTTIILCGTVFVMLFVAGVRLRYLGVAGLGALVFAAVLILGEGYRRARFLSAFHPFADPQGTGYQLIQGYIALGSGGWFGVGLGASRQKWQYVPNAHTDFIFAILGEELGLLGELVVLALFAMVIYAGVRISVRAPDTFGRLLAAGITAWLGLQTIVNLGAVTGLLPITGVPLPLVSFGGSALVATLTGIGALASVARASGGTAPRRRRGTPG